MRAAKRLHRSTFEFHSFGRPILFALAAILAAVGLFAAPEPATAQDDEKNVKVVEQPVLTTKDGWEIHTTYYKSTEGKEASVVVLLHVKAGNRLVWHNGFAQRLQDQGYAVISVDLRKHGQSKGRAGETVDDDDKKKASNKKPAQTDVTNRDYPRMVDMDLEAVKKFIFEEHQKQNLNMRKMAIIAPEMSAPIALNFTLRDWLKKPYDDAPTFASKTPKGQDVQSLVLMSPETNLPGVTTARTISALKNLPIAFLICGASKDSTDKRMTSRIFKQLGGEAQKNSEEKRVYLKTYPYKLRGTDLLGKKIGTEEYILAFLDKHLKKLNNDWTAWRDRRSKLGS